jgi:hypothetical protein
MKIRDACWAFASDAAAEDAPAFVTDSLSVICGRLPTAWSTVVDGTPWDAIIHGMVRDSIQAFRLGARRRAIM